MTTTFADRRRARALHRDPRARDLRQVGDDQAARPEQPTVRQRVPGFVTRLREYGDAPAVVAGGRVLSYAELDRLVDLTATMLGTGRRLVAIAAANTLPCLTGYLAAVRAGHVVLLAPSCRLRSLAEAYDADTVVSADSGGEIGSRVCQDRDGEGTGSADPSTSSGNGDVSAGIGLRHDAPAHGLHPDLALLLSTSGSTGSPKLVRLSRRNLDANATAIGAALGLRATDRAITTLSPAYSYGLSVVNSHLAVGATLVLNEASVTEPRFWELARREQVTTLAGVPYTFELLDAAGFTGTELPSLRLMTCAGGKLAAPVAQRYADLGRAHGWALSLMYGQTEATARMAVQPPALTATHPDCVGYPLAGGALRIADADADGVGTLAYRGPNVMMGYARTPADLANGPELDELVTGDRARITREGLLQIVGRAGTFAKVFGLRIDLGDVDHALAADGYEAASVALDGRIGIAVAPRRGPARNTFGAIGLGPGAIASTPAGVPAGDVGTDRAAARPDVGIDRAAHSRDPDIRGDVTAIVCRTTNLPPAAVAVAVVDELPRTHTGKLDRGATTALVAGAASPASDVAAVAAKRSREVGRDDSGRAQHETARDATASEAAPREDTARQLGATYGKLLGKPVTSGDSFRTLGGDSLSYVAASVAVERICGQLPSRWHERTITELADLAHAARDGADTRFPGPTQDTAPRRKALGEGPGRGQGRNPGQGPGLLRGRLRSRQLETTVLLRAVAIVLIVGSHAQAFDVRGGAHVLVALAGYNLARFCLPDTDLRRRTRRIARSSAEVLVPALLWVAALAALTTTYTWNILGTNWLVNATTEGNDWRYWFVESLLWLLPPIALLLGVPAVERLRQRHPFALPAVGTVAAWSVWQLVVPEVRPVELFSPPAVLWLFLLGWTVAEARTGRQRILVSAMVLALVPWGFANSRAVVVPVALLLVIWADRARIPGPLAATVAVLAEASLFVYLSHWQVLEVVDGTVALMLALPIGVAIHRAVAQTRRRLRPAPDADLVDHVGLRRSEPAGESARPARVRRHVPHGVPA